MSGPKARPDQQPPKLASERRKQLQRLRSRLEEEECSWRRWLGRLKRAFRAFIKSQDRLSRLQRHIAKLQESKSPAQKKGQLASE
jgi:hypothetical protein